MTVENNHNNLFKEQTTFILNTRGGLSARGVPIFLNNYSMNCSLCKQHFDILTPIDFSNMIWKQGETLQAIYKNKDLQKFKLDLCSACRQRIFSSSIVTIKFFQELFNALKERGY